MIVTDLDPSIAAEILELERAAHRLLVHASTTLRAGRPGWEPWFEAGMELQEAAKRLRQAVRSVDSAPADVKHQERKKWR